MLPEVTGRAVLAALLLALPVLSMSASPGGDPPARDPREYFFTQTFGDLPEEMQRARDEGKLGMLLFFEAEACPYCQRMLRTVFNQRRVQDWYQKRFVSIAVDIHGDVELTDFDGISLPSKVFSDHRRVFLTPVICFLDLDGVEVYRHLGMVKTPEEMLLIGEYIEGEHHFDTEYEVFYRQRTQHSRNKILTTPHEFADDLEEGT
jgi:thioredoxin-related protein